MIVSLHNRKNFKLENQFVIKVNVEDNLFENLINQFVFLYLKYLKIFLLNYFQFIKFMNVFLPEDETMNHYQLTNASQCCR